jgi:hypothetical protein
MSNKDVPVQGSQAAAATVFLAELASDAANGHCVNEPAFAGKQSWPALIVANTSNHLYPKA